MIQVVVGTDTYGRVKAVAGTAIVTQFAMLQMVPVYPLRSFYLIRLGRSEAITVPLVGKIESREFVGVPLAAVDWASVIMAYARGLFATLAVAGCIVLVPGIMILTGEHLDDLALLMTKGLLVALAVGVLGGAMTYAVPLTSRRDRAIRQACAEVFGIAIDPARLTAEVRDEIDEKLGEAGLSEGPARLRRVGELVLLRLDVADARDPTAPEIATDEWLEAEPFATPMADQGPRRSEGDHSP